ncbi:hypothetical protein PV350_25020 [Streptomyces sp. PA03-6a]|nr:hypothetical protein [Streptomyces sp. PA03-6a]
MNIGIVSRDGFSCTLKRIKYWNNSRAAVCLLDAKRPYAQANVVSASWCGEEIAVTCENKMIIVVVER